MPAFTRTALLTADEEQQLQMEIKPLWLNGTSARLIAKQLNFGVPNTPYAKLKKHNIYLYRIKWGFPKSPNARQGAGIQKGQKRYRNKQKKTMSFAEFKEKLNAAVPNDNYEYNLRKRAYLILSFWCPLRKSEIFERLRKDFKVEGDLLTIDLYRKKKYYKLNADTEPFRIPLEAPMLGEVLDWLNTWGPEERPFNFGGDTAWRYVKDVFPDYYPHFFRFDWITKGIENAREPGTIIGKMLSDTGLDIRTIKSYIMANPKFQASIGREMIEKETTS
jgi:integrase